MNEKIREHLVNYNMKHGYSTDDDTLVETLLECGKIVYKGKPYSYRWWDEYFCVTELDGMEIGFYNASTTGDDSPYDKGWEFDLNLCCEVERHEETKVIVTYTPVTVEELKRE
jgi:hypothetical protein